LGLVISLVGMKRELIPATINFAGPRHGCDLDFVPNKSRTGKIRSFLAQSAAFGGANAVLAAGECDPKGALPERRRKQAAITGVGIVSAVGCGSASFVEGLRQGRTGIEPIVRFDTAACRAKCAGLVKDFDPRNLLLGLDWRRIDRVAKYAIIATQEALQDA